MTCINYQTRAQALRLIADDVIDNVLDLASYDEKQLAEYIRPFILNYFNSTFKEDSRLEKYIDEALRMRICIITHMQKENSSAA